MAHSKLVFFKFFVFIFKNNILGLYFLVLEKGFLWLRDTVQSRKHQNISLR